MVSIKRKYVIWTVLIVFLLSVIAVLVNHFVQRELLEQRRIELLEDALAPKTAEAAAYDWAEAIKTRNGAWQYALMDEELREEYLEEFESTNWVTGFSSPWVEKYEVSRESEDEEGNIMFKVKFDWYTSGGYSYSNTGTLKVGEFTDGSEKWLITYLDFSYEPES